MIKNIIFINSSLGNWRSCSSGLQRENVVKGQAFMKYFLQEFLLLFLEEQMIDAQS